MMTEFNIQEQDDRILVYMVTPIGLWPFETLNSRNHFRAYLDLHRDLIVAGDKFLNDVPSVFRKWDAEDKD